MVCHSTGLLLAVAFVCLSISSSAASTDDQVGLHLFFYFELATVNVFYGVVAGFCS